MSAEQGMLTLEKRWLEDTCYATRVLLYTRITRVLSDQATRSNAH